MVRWHTLDSEITAQKRVGHVDVLELYVDLVCGSVAGLLSHKLAAGTQERAAVGGEDLAQMSAGNRFFHMLEVPLSAAGAESGQ